MQKDINKDDCAACCKPISTKKINCTACSFNYHTECVNLESSTVTKSFAVGWKCPTCQSKVPKTDNSNTPVRQTATAGDSSSSNTNVTLRPQNRATEKRQLSRASTPDSDSLTALTKEIKLLREDMSDIKKHLKNLTTCMAQCTARLDEYDDRLACSDATIRSLEQKQLENALLHEKVNQLEDQLRLQAQNSVQNEIEILGINEEPNENLCHIVRIVATKIGINLAETDIDDVLRVGPRRNALSTANSEAPLPRPVVLRFVRHMKRNEFLRFAKSRRNITSADLEVAGQPRKLFINERLSKENRHLFRQARHQKSTQGYKYCWTHNGRILIRKREGGPAITIQREADLAKILEADCATSSAAADDTAGSHIPDHSNEDLAVNTGFRNIVDL